MIKSFLNFILIILIFASSVAYTLYKLENPEFLAAQARQVNLYGRISTQFDSLVPSDTGLSVPLTKEETKEILTFAIDGQTFYDFLGKYLTNQVNWLTGKSNTYNFSYDLTAVKNRAQDKTTEIAIARYNDLPVCQSNQLRTWDAAKTFPTCQLPSSSSTTQSDVNAMLQSQVSSFFSGNNSQGKENVANSFTLGSPSPKLESWRSAITTITKGMYLTWLITLGFLLLYLLILRTRAFKSLAFIFIVVGLLQIAFSFVAWGWFARAMGDVIANTGAAALAPIITDAIGVTAEVLKTIMGSLSIITLGIGGVMLILAIYFGLRKPKILSI